MKIVVIGQFCWDCYGSVETEIIQEPGGILYALYALSSVAQKGDVIYPVFPVEKNLFDEIKSNTYQLPYIDWSKLYLTTEKNTKILVSTTENELAFKAISVLTEPIKMEYMPDTEADIIYLNFQTGYEIKTENLSLLKKKYPKAYIHTDIHLLAKRLAQSNKGNAQQVKDSLADVFTVSDSVQLNQQELLGLIISTGLTEKELVKKALIECNVKAFIITKAERGIVCYEKVLNQIETHIIRPNHVSETPGAIGSGDILGAVMVYELQKTGGFKSALTRGIRLAELAATKKGFKAKAEHVRINGALLS